jgi:hypothetical protein
MIEITRRSWDKIDPHQAGIETRTGIRRILAPFARRPDMRNILGIATALVVFTCGGAAAAGMTRDEYKAGKARIAAEYQADRQKCGAHLGDAAELCVARARGAQKVAKAELEAAYKPSPRAHFEAAIARAQAAYAIAKAECDNKEGAARKNCVRDARAARDRAQAEALSARKASSSGEGGASKPAGAPR